MGKMDKGRRQICPFELGAVIFLVLFKRQKFCLHEKNVNL
jgi:hypothetical protein